MAKGKAIFGERFKELREELFVTQEELARSLKMSASGVRRIESMVSVSVSDKTIRGLADVLKLPPSSVMNRLKKPLPPRGEAHVEATATELASEPFDQNVDPESVEEFAPIPLFDLPLAAGGWQDVPEAMGVSDPRVREQALFRVRLCGDSMTPRYADGAVVEFLCMYPPFAGIEVGRDYYVQRNDGTATFKRLGGIKSGVMQLVAINAEKYPKPLRANVADVVRTCLAVAIVEIL